MVDFIEQNVYIICAVAVFIVIVLFMIAWIDMEISNLRERDSQIATYYRIINNIYKSSNNKDYSIKELYEQVNLNYEKVSRTFTKNEFVSTLDLIEGLISRYDVCPDEYFFKTYNQKKDEKIREFLVKLRDYIKNINPFISIPKKEADLLQSIQNALINNNESLGMNSLFQLSEEILYKEKTIIKQEKDNRRTAILSIVGVILTAIFGIISIIQFLGIKLL